jgi:hypothetical protein
VVSVTDPYDRILGFLDRSRYIFLSSSSSVVLTRLSGPPLYIYIYIYICIISMNTPFNKTKLRDLSPRIKGVEWSVQQIPTAEFSVS